MLEEAAATAEALGADRNDTIGVPQVQVRDVAMGTGAEPAQN